MSEKTISQQVVDYVMNLKFSDLPESTIKQQAHSVNDMLACMLAATSLDATAPKVAEYAMREKGPCTILYNGVKTSPEMAALANGCLSHAIDFDDSHDAIVHPSGVVFPAALAVAEYMGDVTGEEFITALVVGTDLSCRFAMAITCNTQPLGWNHPAIIECLGAVFGVGKLMRLNEGQLKDAVAMAMTQFTCSGESLSSKGSVIRTMREGFAAQAVVQSCIMAKYDMHTRFDTPLEGKMGFYTMYTQGGCDLSKITDRLGEFFETDNITYKPWPSCKVTHMPIQALTDLIEENHLKKDEINEVHVKVGEIASMALEPFEAKLAPQSVAMAKSSMPFVIGTILKYGSVNLESFTDERLADPEIKELAKKVTYEYDLNQKKSDVHSTDMTVKTTRGDFFRHQVSCMGGTGYPLSDEQVKDKFFSCLKFYRMLKNEEQIEKLYDACMNVASLKSVGELLSLL